MCYKSFIYHCTYGGHIIFIREDTMPKITQQPVPEGIKPIFKKAGIKIKNYTSTVSFERDLNKFLSRNQVLHLGTCRNSVPRVTPVMYRHHGLIFYVLTEGGGKLSNLRENKTVCFSIAEPYDNSRDVLGNKGLQAWGTANVYSMRHDPEKFRTALKNMNAQKGARKIALENLPPQYHYRLIEIIPDKIKYGNPREGVFQIIWER